MTHSRSFDKSEPSVAAVVGSTDVNATTYACEVNLQGHRQEMIQVRKSQRSTFLSWVLENHHGSLLYYQLSIFPV